MSDRGELATLYARSLKEISSLKARLQEANLKIDNLTSELRETRELLGEVVMANYRTFPLGGRLLPSNPTAAASPSTSPARATEPLPDHSGDPQPHLSHSKRPRSISLEYVDEPPRPSKAPRRQLEEERMSVDPAPPPVAWNRAEVKAEEHEELGPGPDVPQVDKVQTRLAGCFEEGEISQEPDSNSSSTDAVQPTRSIPPEARPQAARTPTVIQNTSRTPLEEYQNERRAGEVLGNHANLVAQDPQTHSRPQDDNPCLHNETQPGAPQVGSSSLGVRRRSAGGNPQPDPQLPSASFSVPLAVTPGDQAPVLNAIGSTPRAFTTSAEVISPTLDSIIAMLTRTSSSNPPFLTTPTDTNYSLRAKRIAIGTNDVLSLSPSTTRLSLPANYVPITLSHPPRCLEVPSRFLRSVVDHLHTSRLYPPGHRPHVLCLGMNLAPSGVPSQPGDVGVIHTIREDVYADSHPWSLFCQRDPSQDLWLYMGEYTASKLGVIDAKLFNLLPKTSKNHIAKQILFHSPPEVYARMRARIALRMHGRLPPIPELQERAVAEEVTQIRSKNGILISEEQVLHAFRKGEETVAVVALLFVGYQYSLMDHVIQKWSTFSDSQPAPAEAVVPKKNQSRSKKRR